MIEGFSNETKPLSQYEEVKLLPVMVRCLSNHVGEEAAITNKQMCQALMDKGYDVSEVRIRKIINYIRITGAVKCLIATSKGYFIASNTEEVKSHIRSLKGREEAISEVRRALEGQIGDGP